MTEAAKRLPIPTSFSEETAIRLLRETEGAVRWMEEVAEALKAQITDPKAKLGQMCEAFVLAKRVNDLLEDGRKLIGGVYQETSYKYLPDRMMDEGCTTFNSDAGFRITVAQRFSASIPAEMKAEAYDWLRANDMGELIVETVNSQTLSAAMRRMVEEENKEPPADLIKTSLAPYTSVTKTKKK